VVVFNSQDSVADAARTLATLGLDVKRLSLVVNGSPTAATRLRFDNEAGPVNFSGRAGAFWGGLCRILFSATSMAISVFGTVVLDPLAGMLVSVVSGAVVTGWLTVLGAAL
jgi:hypothetical protein